MRNTVIALLLLASTPSFAIRGSVRPPTAAEIACKDAPPIFRDVCIWGYSTFVGG